MWLVLGSESLLVELLLENLYQYALMSRCECGIGFRVTTVAVFCRILDSLVRVYYVTTASDELNKTRRINH